MERFIMEPTATAEWQTLVSEAEQACGKHFAAEIESYLVFLLQRFTKRPELDSHILALQYLQSLEFTASLRQDKLRDVGDQCLLMSGLFPERATKLALPVSYFVELGCRAYNMLATLYHKHPSVADLYSALRQQFVSLMDTLQYMRELSGGEPQLSLLQAEKLWRNTGSKHALYILQHASQAMPLFGKENDNDFSIH